MREDNDEPIYSYNDKYVRHFIRQSIKGGRVCAFNQYYKPNFCGGILKMLSRKSKVEGNVYDIIEAYMNYENNPIKFIKEENECKFNNYRDIEEDEMEKYINKKLVELPIPQYLKQLFLNDLLWSCDANSLYSSAMSDDMSIYPRIETRYAFTPDLNDEIVEKTNEGNFTQGSAVSKIKHYNPKNLIVQHLPVKERVKKLKINLMRNGVMFIL